MNQSIMLISIKLTGLGPPLSKLPVSRHVPCHKDAIRIVSHTVKPTQDHLCRPKTFVSAKQCNQEQPSSSSDAPTTQPPLAVTLSTSTHPPATNDHPEHTNHRDPRTLPSCRPTTPHASIPIHPKSPVPQKTKCANSTTRPTRTARTSPQPPSSGLATTTSPATRVPPGRRRRRTTPRPPRRCTATDASTATRQWGSGWRLWKPSGCVGRSSGGGGRRRGCGGRRGRGGGGLGGR